jgi:hypothetical protein
MKQLIRIAAFLVITILFTLALIAFAQTPPAGPPKSYTPTEVQSLRLKVAQQAALLAQRDVNDAQTRFQASIAAFRAEADKVKAENHWPDVVTFDMGALTFAAPAVAAPPAPAATAPKGAKP